MQLLIGNNSQHSCLPPLACFTSFYSTANRCLLSPHHPASRHPPNTTPPPTPLPRVPPQQIELQPGVVAGNQLQALVTLHLQVPADRVKLWQPLTLQPKNIPRQLYDLAVMFEPTTVQPEQQAQLHQHTKGGLLQSTCGVAPAHAVRSSGASSSSGSVGVGSGGAAISQVVGGGGPDIRSAIVRRIGFRTVELVQQPIQAARQELLTPPTPTPPQPQQQQQSAIPATSAAAGTSSSVDTTAAAPTQQHQQQSDDPSSQQGESFYFRVNGVPLFAKGANLIPLHVLSTAVTLSDVRALLESAVAANMNMIRIWGGGRYQVCVFAHVCAVLCAGWVGVETGWLAACGKRGVLQAAALWKRIFHSRTLQCSRRSKCMQVVQQRWTHKPRTLFCVAFASVLLCARCARVCVSCL